MTDVTPQLPLFTIDRDGVAQELPQIVPIDRPRVKDITGQRFNRLLVLGYVGTNPHGHATWLCLCDCGQYSVVARSGLIHGTTRSCGCLQREWATTDKLTHGMTLTPEYRCWRAIINRCENPKSAQYKDYGGRGIAVCERWRHSFENFLADMGAKPGPKYSIERLGNDLGYSPDNCRWATATEQMNNMSRNRYLDFRGERLTVSQWAKRIGIRAMNLYDRLHKGWSVERALTEPLKHR